MGAVLLQEEDFKDERAAEAEENAREKCLFEKTIGGLCLQPVASVSHKKRPIHAWARPASSGGLLKIFRKYLYRTEFTVLTNCSGIKNFFNNTDHASRVVQSWKVELLQFHFVIQHRPARMI